MNHPHEALLHDFVDDELGAPERARVADHLAECPACRAVVSPILGLRREARRAFDAPDAARTPAPPDLWERVEARIASPPSPTAGRHSARPTGRSRGRWPGRRPSRARPRAAWAAAVVLLAGFSFSLAYYLARPEEGGRGASPLPSAVAVPDAGHGAGGAASIVRAYDPVLAEMERLLEEGRGRLLPETIATLEESLRIIDGAIGEVQDALASDPGHPGVLRSLEGAYQAKLRLLRQAVVLAPPEG